MKKYIGITLYFVGLVLLSYTFFYKSSIYKKISLNSKATSTEKILLSGTNKDLSGNQDKLSNPLITIGFNSSGLSANKQSTEELTGIDLQLIEETGNKEQVNAENESEKTSIQNKSSNSESVEVVPDKIFVGLDELDKVNNTPYDDVISFLNLTGAVYKVNDKRIYVILLKNIDYQSEKSNINQLIQNVGGNIVETDLYGDKQLFVNPSMYYKKVVIMLVQYDNNVYVVLLPYSSYQQYKSYLKDVLFVK